MYVCGPTVYQRAHIGNARPFVVFSWLRDWLRERGHDVTFVHNITDVNDKIYDAAPGRSAERAAEATEWYLEDTAALGLGMPDALPRATQTVAEIVALIEELVASGHAYAVDGDVYFRVASFPATASSRATGRTSCWTRSRARTRRIRATLRCGRRPRRARTPPGSRRGARAGQVGTSSAP